MRSPFSVVRLKNSANRGPDLAEQARTLPGQYLYFASEGETVDEKRVLRMLKNAPRSAELILPLPHTACAKAEQLEEPAVLPLSLLLEQYRTAPLLNGALLRKSALLERLKDGVPEWMQTPCPDLTIMLFLPVKACIVRTVRQYDPETVAAFCGHCSETEEWLARQTVPDREILLGRFLRYEDYLIDAALETGVSPDRLRNWFSLSSVLHNFFTCHPEKLLSLPPLPAPEPHPGPVRKAAVFCWALRTGGAERCASLLIQNWRKQNPEMEITLFQCSPRKEGDYPLPEQVETVVLPADYYRRRHSVLEQLRERQIDTCIFVDHFLEITYYDLLAARQLGIRTVAMEHSAYAFVYYGARPELQTLREKVYSGADAVTCLSRSDEYLWNLRGIHARYLPNPLTFEPRNDYPPPERKGRTLIFIARMIPGKGVEAALRVTELVRKKYPDVRLQMLGAFPHPEYEKIIREYVRTHKLEDCVEFTGFTGNVAEYLAGAAIHLMPSAVEGYPMTMMEAKAYGVPTIAFSMPYLEAAKEEYGTLSVPKQDCAAMAQLTVELFDNPERLNTLSRKAFEALKHFGNPSVFRRWNLLFQYLESGTEPAELALPCRTPEQQLAMLRLQNDEILTGISVMQCSAAYRECILNEEISIRRKNNILFGCVIRLYFALQKLIWKDSFAANLLFGQLKCLLDCLYLAKRIYRSFHPWKDEEQKL